MVRMYKRTVFFVALLIFQLLFVGYAEQADTLGSVQGRPLACAICPVKNNAPAIVTIISDDGVFESACILNELAKALDIKVTLAGNEIRMKDYLEEWQNMEKEGYIEVCNHGANHIDVTEDTSKEDIIAEYKGGQDFIRENFTSPSFTFVTPNNHTTETGYEVIKECNFLAVRQGSRGFNNIPPAKGTEPGQWYRLFVKSAGDFETTEERNAYVDEAIADGTWLIIMFHNVSRIDDGWYQTVLTKDAKEHLKYVSEKKKEGEIWVASYGEAVSYLYTLENATVEAYNNDDEVEIVFTKTNQDLPWDEFNTDVTVCLTLPDGWEAVQDVESPDGDNMVPDEEGKIYLNWELSREKMTLKIVK